MLLTHVMYSRGSRICSVTGLWQSVRTRIQTLTGRSRFLHSKLLLFRRTALQVARKSLSGRAVSSLGEVEQRMLAVVLDVCAAAAQEIIEITKPHIGTWLLPPTWYSVFGQSATFRSLSQGKNSLLMHVLALYTAGTLLVLTFIFPSLRPTMDTAQHLDIHRSWDLCLSCLKDYEQLNVRGASKCLSNLSKIYKASMTAHTCREGELTSCLRPQG